MKWKSKAYAEGEYRERTAFLWFPKTAELNGYNVTKWFVRATWMERYHHVFGWMIMRWMEETNGKET